MAICEPALSHTSRGQGLWEVITCNEIDPPAKESSLRKWRIKGDKAMFVLKIAIEEELVEHRDWLSYSSRRMGWYLTRNFEY